jgi:cell division protein ZapA (FtsZ GTPase activity inhibitor)
MPRATKAEKAEGKKCFVISPIGSDNSDIRRRADQVYKHIICPPLEQAGYEVVRADKISDPGMITSQIIEHVVSDDLVIADLTGHNPNVFYELAVRHAVGKPFIQIIDHKEDIPFDIAGFRTIHFDHKDLDSAAQAKEEIAKQVEAISSQEFRVITPLNVTIDMQKMQSSGDLEEVYLSKMFEAISSMQSQISLLDRRIHLNDMRRNDRRTEASLKDFYDPVSNTSFRWSKENENILTEMWADGKSASEIAKVVGSSRNAVIGKAHRIGLHSKKGLGDLMNSDHE